VAARLALLIIQVCRALPADGGLALVQGLVELHGGAGVAGSAGLGQGSTFNVVLPTAARATQDGAPQRGAA
jgi:signal transduction histidine kinase